MNSIFLLWATFSLCLFSFNQTISFAEGLSNSNSLKGVSEIKVYFDLNVGEPKKLLSRLQLIETTYSQLREAGFSPRVVIGIRGMASYYFTKDTDYVLEQDIPDKKRIASWAEKFRAHGFALEQCTLAAELHEIDTTDFLPQLIIVPNGYISMIGYQTKGYAYVPMD